MKFWVGVTDNNWYDFQSEKKPDEVNFWQPSGTPPFKKAIELFLFKLHSPLNYIAGGGYFITYSNLPISLAWETFGEKNGLSSYKEFREKILHYREAHGRVRAIDPEIGCSVLAQPFFFPRNEWIPIPQDWKPNIVRGKMYDSQTEVGAVLLDKVQLRMKSIYRNDYSNGEIRPPETHEFGARYGVPYLTRPRLGQGCFRTLVTDAYSRRCAMTGERTLPVLEAAHIRSYSEDGPHTINNGLLLRADLHKLFDRHYITITQELKIEVSKRIHEEYENGKEYYKLHGNTLAVYPVTKDIPSPQYIEWHNNRFRS